MDSSAITRADEAVTGLVSDPAEACRLLVRLRHQRNLVAVRPAGAAREHNSIVLALDTAQRYLVLDAPRPRPPEHAFRPGTRIYARSHIDGAPLIFIATVDALLQSGSDYVDTDVDVESALLLHWPERISYHQRRQDYRVTVPATMVPTPARLLRDGHIVEARLVDLSAAGAAILLSRDKGAITAGEEVGCVLPLPDHDLRTTLRVRSTTPVAAGLRISGELLLDNEQERESILHAVMAIERWWIRSR